MYLRAEIDPRIRHYIVAYCNFAVVGSMTRLGAVFVPKPFGACVQIKMLI
jgi:hypothetical protein